MLLDQGCTVVGLDNFSDYYSVSLKRDRFARLLSNPGFTGVEGDCAVFESVTKTIEAHRIEVVCHLAAQAGVRYSVTHPFVCGRANLDGFLSVIEACRQCGIARLVYASSSSVYGGNTKLPFSEEDRTDAPISLYAATKRANELMAHAYTHIHGMQTIGLRFFTVYGPWGRPDMAVWRFTEDMLAGRAIDLFNHGDMRRDFTFVTDIAAAVCKALSSEHLERYEVLNLGNHKPEHLMDVVRILATELGVEPKMNLLPMQPGDVPATYADIERAGSKLEFEPRTSIKEGLPLFVRWYREYRLV
jgi:UDP-glucuronate 4-epimerase